MNLISYRRWGLLLPAGRRATSPGAGLQLPQEEQLQLQLLHHGSGLASPRSFNGSPSWRSGSEVETLSDMGAFGEQDQNMVHVKHLETIVEEDNTWSNSTGHPAEGI